MLISHSHKFIYFAPQKTGTTTLHSVLENEFGAILLGDRHDIYLPEEYQHYYTFCSVRNPYTRAVSAFNEVSRKRNVDLEECFEIDNRHWARPIYVSLFEREVPDTAVPMRLDAFIKMESLEKDFNELPFIEKFVELPILNKSNGFRMAYGCRVYEWAREFYQKDFDFFKYSQEWTDLGLKIM